MPLLASGLHANAGLLLATAPCPPNFPTHSSYDSLPETSYYVRKCEGIVRSLFVSAQLVLNGGIFDEKNREAMCLKGRCVCVRTSHLLES